MKLRAIGQEPSIEAGKAILTATISDVESHCILARKMIEVLGRPGKDSDLEMLGTDDVWTIIWTEPQLSLEEATHLMNRALASTAS